MTSRTEKVARNTAILVLVFALNAVAGTVTTILLGHALDVEELALYGTWFRACSWIGMLAIFLVPPVLLRYTAELNGAKREGAAWKLLYHSIFLEGFILLLLGLGFWAFSDALFQATDRGRVFASIVILSATLFAMAQVLESFLRGLQDFAPIATATGISSCLRLVLLSGMFLYGGGAIVALCIYGAGQAAMLLILSRRIRHLSPPIRDDEKERESRIGGRLLGRITDYGLSMGAGGVLSLFIWHYPEVFFIGWLWEGRPDVEQHIAWYTLAIGLAALPLRLGKVLSASMLPAFSELYGAADSDAFRRGYHRATVLSAFVGLPFVAVTIAAAPILVRALFPEHLHHAAIPFQLVLVPGLFMAVHQAGGAALPALEGHRFYLVTTLILAPLCILLNLLLVPRWGSIGAALVNAIAQSLAAATGIYYVAVRRHIGFPTGKILVTVALSIVAAGVVYAALLAAPTHRLLAIAYLACVITGVMVLYILAAATLKILDREECAALGHLVKTVPSPIRPFGHALIALLRGGAR